MKYPIKIESGQEFIDIGDDIMIPTFTLHTDSGTIGCGNCDWHNLSEEKQESIVEAIRKVFNEHKEG
jgi:hypothetical protein